MKIYKLKFIKRVPNKSSVDKSTINYSQSWYRKVFGIDNPAVSFGLFLIYSPPAGYVSFEERSLFEKADIHE